MFLLNEKIFLFLYHALGPTSYVSGATIFFAGWFPFIVAGAALVYELFIRDDGDTFRSLVRIFIPPSLVYFSTEAFKFFYEYPRPFAALEIPPSVIVSDPFGSFPSSHTAFFSALAVTMFFCNPKVGKLFFVCAIVIGLARIGAGVHWPIDILGGLVWGIFLGFVIEKIALMIWKERTPMC